MLLQVAISQCHARRKKKVLQRSWPARATSTVCGRVDRHAVAFVVCCEASSRLQCRAAFGKATLPCHGLSWVVTGRQSRRASSAVRSRVLAKRARMMGLGATAVRLGRVETRDSTVARVSTSHGGSLTPPPPPPVAREPRCGATSTTGSSSTPRRCSWRTALENVPGRT